MNERALLLAVGAILLSAVAGLIMITLHLERMKRVDARLAAVAQQLTRSKIVIESDQATSVTRLIAQFGQRVAGSGLLSSKTVEALRATLLASGMRTEMSLGLFIGSKIVLLLSMPLLAWAVTRALGVAPAYRTLLLGVGFAVGLLLPDVVVRQVRASYLKRVERGVPDTLDLLVICAQAGMGLEPSINRVVTEIAFAHPQMSEELALTATELHLFPDAQTPLINLGKRTGLDSLARLGTTLIQSIQYGTPLTEALRLLANELRQEMLTRFEERAARLPVLLTIPMVTCILPALFLVIGGPAAIQVIAAFHRH